MVVDGDGGIVSRAVWDNRLRRAVLPDHRGHARRSAREPRDDAGIIDAVGAAGRIASDGRQQIQILSATPGKSAHASLQVSRARDLAEIVDAKGFAVVAVLRAADGFSRATAPEEGGQVVAVRAAGG